MALWLRQGTASQEIPLGYFLDSGDGDAEETGLTIANTDIKLWKTGAITLANKNSGGATHISNGVYYAVLDATDTDTLGPMVLFVHVSGALAIRVECLVLPANVYDALVLGTDKLQVHVDEITNDLITAAAIATGAIDADAIAAAAANKIADHIIRRNYSNVEGSSDGDTIAFRSMLGAGAKATNKLAPNGANIEIFRTNDTTVLGTQTPTTDAGADPITALDTV